METCEDALAKDKVLVLKETGKMTAVACVGAEELGLRVVEKRWSRRVMNTFFVLSKRLRGKGGMKDTSKNETCSLESLIDPCAPPYASSRKAETTAANAFHPCKRKHNIGS